MPYLIEGPLKGCRGICFTGGARVRVPGPVGSREGKKAGSALLYWLAVHLHCLPTTPSNYPEKLPSPVGRGAGVRSERRWPLSTSSRRAGGALIALGGWDHQIREHVIPGPVLWQG